MISGKYIVKNMKQIIFMRHASTKESSNGYKNLEFEQFMKLLLKSIDPPISAKDKNLHELPDFRTKLKFVFKKNNHLKNRLEYFKIGEIPKNIEIIYHSPTRRAIQTAKLVRNQLLIKPKIDDSLKRYLAEVKFSSNVISKQEYNDGGGLKGCRPLILEKWFNGQNLEKFENSLKRLIELDKRLRTSPYTNILLITHGWFLRLIYLFYEGKILCNNEGELISDKKEALEYLKQAPRLKCGETIEYYIDSRSESAVYEKFNEKELLNY